MSVSIDKKVRAETLVRLDVRQFFKIGALRPGAGATVERSDAFIHCRADRTPPSCFKPDSDAIAGGLRLLFDPHDFDALAQSVQLIQHVPILVRRFDFGGWSPFWECPGCQARRWVLHGPLHGSFQCAGCHRLSYQSGLISDIEQAQRRYAQLRKRLGADEWRRPRALFPRIGPLPPRPKGMSKRDYEAARRVCFRLQDQVYDHAVRLAAWLFR